MKSCRCELLIKDGDHIAAGDTIMQIFGTAAQIVSLERTVLNLVSRMSGIATVTHQMASKLPDGVQLLATRKTAPGLRLFDKEAVEAGGGLPHRYNLGSMIMIKDNHIAAEGSMDELIQRAAAISDRYEVEADTIQDALHAARLGAPMILLDNFTIPDIHSTVQDLRREGLREGVKLEASGGITPQNITEYGASGVDYVSSGYMTSSAPSLDISLDLASPEPVYCRDPPLVGRASIAAPETSAQV